ncbi:MAG: hypothetical protein IPK52_27245 [Chloroflexi bacterium]|nr:hypothetical protein [Chloroflexota bacterium]
MRSTAHGASDSIRHRKSKQITVGIPPFGTMRNAGGYLTATRLEVETAHGGWQGGETAHETPMEGA